MKLKESMFWIAIGFFSTFVPLSLLDEERPAQDHAATCEYPVDEATAQYLRGWNAAMAAVGGE